jgi:DNA (cytosine-5)-methyltransferase 1
MKPLLVHGTEMRLPPSTTNREGDEPAQPVHAQIYKGFPKAWIPDGYPQSGPRATEAKTMPNGLTSVSMFSGGGLADLGLMAAGWTPIGACEHDPKIAAVYRANIGDHIEVGDVRSVDPSRWAGADLLWASPPCQAHSVARSKNLPDREDADVGLDVLRWVKAIGPRIVIVENVPGYTKHPAFCAIVAGLSAMGYGVRWDVVDFADMGVPQNRTRVILRAERDACLLPMLPAAVPWVGWYQAVEDLIPTFPESKFAPWQLKRLPLGIDVFDRTLLVTNKRESIIHAPVNPETDTRIQTRDVEEPSPTIKTLMYWRAFLFTDDATPAGSLRCRAGSEPSNPVTAQLASHTSRALLVNTNMSGDDGDDCRTRDGESPAFTVSTSISTRGRAWLDSGRVVALTPRAIARLQTVPDWYVLPDTKTLAGTVLGNGVPCLAAQRIAEVHYVA